MRLGWFESCGLCVSNVGVTVCRCVEQTREDKGAFLGVNPGLYAGRAGIPSKSASLRCTFVERVCIALLFIPLTLDLCASDVRALVFIDQRKGKLISVRPFDVHEEAVYRRRRNRFSSVRKHLLSVSFGVTNGFYHTQSCLLKSRVPCSACMQRLRDRSRSSCSTPFVALSSDGWRTQ